MGQCEGVRARVDRSIRCFEQPDKIVIAAVYLASDATEKMNGANLTVARNGIRAHGGSGPRRAMQATSLSARLVLGRCQHVTAADNARDHLVHVGTACDEVRLGPPVPQDDDAIRDGQHVV